jgi:predicted nucleotidyltransferase component of viral defense system
MLRTETVTPATLELLTGLMRDAPLNDFFLAGGTALSLQIGHRFSIDLDMFSVQPFDEQQIVDYLMSKEDFQLNYRNKNTIKGAVNRVQVDLIRHGYPLVKPLTIIDGIRLASLEDIAAMKLNAITGNGTRAKDFVDMAYLSCYLSLNEMLDAFTAKYDNVNPFVAVRSLAFTRDVNTEEPIRLMNKDYSWELIETRIKALPAQPDLIFPPL